MEDGMNNQRVEQTNDYREIRKEKGARAKKSPCHGLSPLHSGRGRRWTIIYASNFEGVLAPTHL